MGFSTDLFRKQLKAVGSALALPKFKQDSYAKLDKVKLFIKESIENHTVSQELRNHTSPSRYLKNSDGTLFGFLGFEAGSNPVQDLIDYFDREIVLLSAPTRGRFVASNIIRIPNYDDMSTVGYLMLPWTSGASWPEMLEDGVAGLSSFLSFPTDSGYTPEKSVSQEGFQAKTEEGVSIQVRRNEMRPVKFLSPILEKASKL